MGLGTPNFFSSAWNPEQNDFSFTEAYQSGNGNHTGYTPQLFQGQAENNQLDYFSGTSGDQFSSQSIYQSRQQQRFSQSPDDLDRILGAGNSAFLDKNVDTAHPEAIFNSYGNSYFSSSGLGVPSLNDWNPDTKQNAAPAKIMTQLANVTGRRTSMRFGQITPVDSPPDKFLPPAQKTSKQSTSKSKGDDANTANNAPKAKKPRKSKKKPMSKEQEEAKRKKFLERNRVAADKCRQNRKKWIDDLQNKAHFFGADNSAKKAQLEDLEHEIIQLRSLIFIHSRSCNENDIVNWIEQEASKVQLDGAELKQSGEGSLSNFSQNAGEVSSSSSPPTSSHGYGSVSDAVSRRYSAVTADDDFISVLSAAPSEYGSRRPSTAQ